MSYADTFRDSSDISARFIRDTGQFCCYDCKLSDVSVLAFATPTALREHFADHVSAGHVVPAYAIQCIEGDIAHHGCAPARVETHKPARAAVSKVVPAVDRRPKIPCAPDTLGQWTAYCVGLRAGRLDHGHVPARVTHGQVAPLTAVERQDDTVDTVQYSSEIRSGPKGHEQSMESTVLQPTPGQTVVTTDTDHGHRGHGGHHFGATPWEVSTDKHEQRRIHETSRDFAEVEKSICETGKDSLRQFEILTKQVSDAATATVVGFKDSLAIAYQVEGRALLEAAKNANAASVQATMFANAASVEAAKNFYASSLEAVKNASASELTARTIAAQASKEAADCCCELKALITANGEATRTMLAASDTQKLRDQLQALQLANSSLFARNVPPVVPVI